MKRCLLLTDGTESADDRLVCQPLIDLGWDVSFRNWPDVPPWPVWRPGPTSALEPGPEADIVVIRSTWDYHHRPARFLTVLNRWNRLAYLENALPYVRWNSRKTYLDGLWIAGIPFAPTHFSDGISRSELEHALKKLGPKLVIKPQVSASAERTFQVTASSLASEWPVIERALAGKPVLCQTFVDSIVEEGEYSLIFFSGRFSHAVIKTPDRGDFRVQEEFGGTTRPVVPDPELVLAAERAIAAATGAVRLHDAPPPLYARVDMARGNDRDEEYWLMELELIEPGLFLRTDPEAPSRFAAAIDERASAFWAGH